MRKKTKGKPSKPALDPLDDDSLLTESDRGCALVGGAMVDEGLRLALLLYFEPDVASSILDDMSSSPLATFASRIKMARALSIIDADVYADLKVIKEVRNAAAHFEKEHGFNTGFDTPAFRAKLLNLRVLSDDLRTALKPAPRVIYQMYCVCMLARLAAVSRRLDAGVKSGQWGLDAVRKGVQVALRMDSLRSWMNEHHVAYLRRHEAFSMADAVNVVTQIATALIAQGDGPPPLPSARAAGR